jgi:hypothetical protein
MCGTCSRRICKGGDDCRGDPRASTSPANQPNSAGKGATPKTTTPRSSTADKRRKGEQPASSQSTGKGKGKTREEAEEEGESGEEEEEQEDDDDDEDGESDDLDSDASGYGGSSSDDGSEEVGPTSGRAKGRAPARKGGSKRPRSKSANGKKSAKTKGGEKKKKLTKETEKKQQKKGAGSNKNAPITFTDGDDGDDDDGDGDDESFLCKLCNINQGNKYQLDMHKCPKKPFACPDCGLRFEDKEAREEHWTAAHPTSLYASGDVNDEGSNDHDSSDMTKLFAFHPIYTAQFNEDIAIIDVFAEYNILRPHHGTTLDEVEPAFKKLFDRETGMYKQYTNYLPINQKNQLVRFRKLMVTCYLSRRLYRNKNSFLNSLTARDLKVKMACERYLEEKVKEALKDHNDKTGEKIEANLPGDLGRRPKVKQERKKRERDAEGGAKVGGADSQQPAATKVLTKEEMAAVAAKLVVAQSALAAYMAAVTKLEELEKALKEQEGETATPQQTTDIEAARAELVECKAKYDSIVET